MGTRSTLALTAFPILVAIAGCAETATRDGEPRDREGVAASAIQGGFVDVRDDGVVGVALVDEGGRVRRTCSGTLIAPNLVITAQHCVADTKETVVCRSSMFGERFPAGRLRVTASDSMWAEDTDWERVHRVLTPPGPPRVCGRDVALLVLERPLACVPIIAPRLEGPPSVDEVYAAIGYGASRGGAHDAGLRRRRDALRVMCVDEACDTPQVAGGEWRGDHGICNGDSGGPALDAEGRLIGVTSRGPAGCEDPIYGGLAAHAEWIRDGAARAADHGAYDLPNWAEPPPPVPADCGPPVVASGGCSLGGGSGREEGAWIAAAIVAIGLAARRRSAAGARWIHADP